MAFITPEEFNKIVRNDYDNLTEDDFNDLLSKSFDKVKELFKAGEFKYDNERVLYSLNKHYQLSLDVFKNAADSRKLSFQQYKVLCTFIKKHAGRQQQPEFKQF
jgi:hypothetical protein